MTSRFVWEKWSAERKVKTYTNSTSTALAQAITNTSSYNYIWYIKYGDSYEVDLGTGNFSISNGTVVTSTTTIPAGKYFAVYSSSSQTGNKTEYINRAITNTTISDSVYNYADGTGRYEHSCKTDTSYERITAPIQKGDSSYGIASSAQSGAYPTNGLRDNYWYVYLGEDCIDPDSVSHTKRVLCGLPVELTIMAGSENQYGGNIFYTVQTSTNGGSWTTEGTTQETNYMVTVPANAQTWNARVLASDNGGFSSSTYIYANAEAINPSALEFLPDRWDLGWLLENTVSISIINYRGTSCTYTAKLNGENILTQTSSSTAPVVITLTDEQWEALSYGKQHFLEISAVLGDGTAEIYNEFKFGKFRYDDATLSGVMEGLAEATRLKLGTEDQILGKDFPKKVLSIDNPVDTPTLQSATATPDTVFAGKTFVAWGAKLETGTALSVPSTATPDDIYAGKLAYNSKGELLTGTGRHIFVGSIQPPIEYKTYTVYYPSGITEKPKAMLAYFNTWVGSYATPNQQPSFSPYFFRGAVSGQLNGITAAESGTMRNQNQSMANTTISVGTTFFSVTFSQYDYCSGQEFCYICIW